MGEARRTLQTAKGVTYLPAFAIKSKTEELLASHCPPVDWLSNIDSSSFLTMTSSATRLVSCRNSDPSWAHNLALPSFPTRMALRADKTGRPAQRCAGRSVSCTDFPIHRFLWHKRSYLRDRDSSCLIGTTCDDMDPLSPL